MEGHPRRSSSPRVDKIAGRSIRRLLRNSGFGWWSAAPACGRKSKSAAGASEGLGSKCVREEFFFRKLGGTKCAKIWPRRGELAYPSATALGKSGSNDSSPGGTTQFSRTHSKRRRTSFSKTYGTASCELSRLQRREFSASCSSATINAPGSVMALAAKVTDSSFSTACQGIGHEMRSHRDSHAFRLGSAGGRVGRCRLAGGSRSEAHRHHRSGNPRFEPALSPCREPRTS
jgi:hypothetical protein